MVGKMDSRGPELGPVFGLSRSIQRVGSLHTHRVDDEGFLPPSPPPPAARECAAGCFVEVSITSQFIWTIWASERETLTFLRDSKVSFSCRPFGPCRESWLRCLKTLQFWPVQNAISIFLLGYWRMEQTIDPHPALTVQRRL